MIRGGFVTLPVSDVERAVRFYVETLGMKLVEDGGAARAVIDAGEGFRIALEKGAGGGGAVRLDLAPKIPLAEAVAILDNRGVAFRREKDGVVEIAVFADPDGNALALRG